MKMQLKRIVSAVCAVALCASVVTTPVLAIDGDDTSVPGTTQSESSASEGTQVETPAPEEPTANNGQPEDTEPVEPENTQEDPVDTLADPATGDGQQEDITNDMPEEPAGEEPGSSVPSDDGAATPSVMSYKSVDPVHVNVKSNVDGKDDWYINNHSWTLENGGNEYIKLDNTDKATVTITGLKATPSGEPVTLTHEYTEWMRDRSETFEITVLPADPAEVYFYVAIPSNTTMSSEGSDYRFMMHGGTVKNPEANIIHQKEDPILSFEDESVFDDYIATWPTGDEKGKITLGNSNNAFGSEDVDADSWLKLAENGSITDFSITFSIPSEDGSGSKKVTYEPQDEDGNHYALRWTKFSYASTDTANWQYHLDAMLYKVVTVEDAFEVIAPEKTVDAFALGDDGQPTDSTFEFALTCLDKDRSVNIPLTATVNASGQTTVDIDVKNPDDANQELLPGTYQIAENTPAANIWQDPSNDVIQFTVASDGTVDLVQEQGYDNKIANIQQTYTVTYAAGVEDSSVSNMPSDSTKYKYNESATVQAAPKRIGFDFAGWSDGVNTYEAGKSIKITGNVTLTAQWEEQDPGTVGPAGDVDIDKTASEELVNDEADVTLSIGGTQEELEAYVLFVLDKSTSTDVRDEAAVMLDELMKQVNAGYSINVGVISFEREVDDLLNGWMELNKDGYQQIVDALNTKRDESGTNIYLGLREAKAKMDALTGVDAAYKHIVLVTDGITYLWSNSEDTSDTKLYSIYSESISYTEESINAGMDMIVKHHPDNYDAFVAEFADMKTWMQTYGDAVAKDIATYQHVYGEGQYKPDVQGQQDNSTYNTAGFDEGDYIPGESLTDHYSANEAAVYMATTVWQEIVNAGYHAYAYADVTGESNSANAAKNPWAANFISGLGTIGGNTGRVTTAAVDGMFDDVKSSIIYAIDHGTVTDVIGKDFDLKVAEKFEDSFTLTVGGVEQTQKTAEDNTVKFGTADDKGVYPYVVTYCPDGVNGDTQEQFVWQINTPVESTAGLQLTYKVKLVNVPTEIGPHTLYTNEEATLDYTSTNGGTGSEEFPKPEVTYNVVGVTPASLTIYMGGSSGYGNIVGEDGQTLSDTVSLPEPGFYLELTEEMNAELRAVLGKESTDIIDLSGYVTLTAGDNKWTLERYGYTTDGAEANEDTSAGYIEDQSRFIYKIVPVQGGTPVRVKVSKDTEIKTDDEFEIQDKLYEEYDMEIYGEGIDAADLKLSINIPAADRKDGVEADYTTSSGLVGGDPATLTVRYVTGQQEDVVTDALSDIGDAEDPNKAYVVLKDLEGTEAKDFIINEAVNGLTVQADPDSVALLFDDIVSSDDTNDEDTHFEQTLVENAVEATANSFQDLQYQAKYLDLVDANNGNTWLTTNDNVTVYWPYPEGTNKNTTFYLQHFEGIDRDGTLKEITEEVEETTPVEVEVHLGDDGIYFETNSFSPYVLMWDKTTPAVDDGGKEETSTPASTPSPTAAPAKDAQPGAAPVAAVIPQTGDDSQPMLWVALVGISGVALAALAVYRKKRSDK